MKLSIFIAMIGLSTLVHASQPTTKKIRVRADVWCPFNCQPQSANEGIFIEILRMALEGEGYQVDYQLMNWARAIEDTRAGKYEAIVGASKTDAPDFIFTSQPLAGTNYEFFTLKNKSWRFVDENSLKNVKIGIINGYFYDDKFMELAKKFSSSMVVVSGEEGLDQLVKMLDKNRIDVLIESPGVFKNYIQEQKKNIADYREAGETEKKMQLLYAAFSPKFKEAGTVEKLITNQINSLRKSGKLKNLLKKYNLKDIQ